MLGSHSRFKMEEMSWLWAWAPWLCPGWEGPGASLLLNSSLSLPQVIWQASSKSLLPLGIIPCLKTRGTLLLSRQNLHSGVWRASTSKRQDRGAATWCSDQVPTWAPSRKPTKPKPRFLCSLGLPVSICPRWGWTSPGLCQQHSTEPTSPGTTLSSNQFSDDCVCLYACMSVRRHAKSLQLCPALCTPWSVAHQAPLSMGFSRQEYWSGLPCPPPGDLPDPEIEPVSLAPPALAGGFFIISATWGACLFISWTSNPVWRRILLSLGLLESIGLVVVQSLSCVQLFATSWTAACQGPLSCTVSWGLLKHVFIESLMLFNHLVLCRPLLLLPSIFPRIRVFSHDFAFWIKWPKYWHFSISPSSEFSGLISFRID